MIDVIIPTYNSSKYIIDTLNSIMKQTIVDKINVYVIDDCSTDDYSDVINLFSKYINIKYYKLEKNSGPGVARQFGIEHSNGEYIIFMDSDDAFFSKDAAEKLYNAIDKHDILIGQIYFERYNKFLHHNGCLHGKIYRRSFIENNGIKFNDMRSHEDNAFNKICLSVADFSYLDEVIYDYRCVSDSITSTQDGVDSLHAFITCMNYAFEKINTFDKANQNIVASFIYDAILFVYASYVNYPEPFSFVFDRCNYLKENYYKYIKYLLDGEKESIDADYELELKSGIGLDEFLDKIKKENE